MIDRPLTATGPAGGLTGSLWLPESRPRGTVLLHPGSGPSDRTNDGYFDDHIAALRAAGFAAAGFDKRGVGGSEGAWTRAGIEDQAKDAAAAAAAVRAALPDVPLHLFGHSQGGWVVYAASGLVRPVTVSATSGPGVSPAEQQTFSTRMALQGAGWPEAEVAAGADVVADQFTCAVAGIRDLPSIPEDFLERLRQEGIFLIEDDETWTLISRLGGYEPLAALRAFDRPLFAAFGAADDMVPVDSSLDVLKASVPPQWLTVHVVEGADHVLRRAGSAPLFLDAWLAFLIAHS